jgi:hypothetical protein
MLLRGTILFFKCHKRVLKKTKLTIQVIDPSMSNKLILF